MASAAIGMLVANSALAPNYNDILHTKVGGLDVLHWINDGLMALFFLLVELEIKREMAVERTKHLVTASVAFDRRLRRNARTCSRVCPCQLADAGDVARLGCSDCN